MMGDENVGSCELLEMTLETCHGWRFQRHNGVSGKVAFDGGRARRRRSLDMGTLQLAIRSTNVVALLHD